MPVSPELPVVVLVRLNVVMFEMFPVPVTSATLANVMPRLTWLPSSKFTAPVRVLVELGAEAAVGVPARARTQVVVGQVEGRRAGDVTGRRARHRREARRVRDARIRGLA